MAKLISALLIKSDISTSWASLWYYKHRGNLVPLCRLSSSPLHGYESRQEEGYVNVVSRNHALVVRVDSDTLFYGTHPAKAQITPTSREEKKPVWNRRHTNDTNWETFRNQSQYKTFLESFTAGVQKILKDENDPNIRDMLLIELSNQEWFCRNIWELWGNELPVQKECWVPRGETR